MKLSETEKLEGIGEVTKEDIKQIELQENKIDEFIGFECDEEVEQDEL